MSSYVPQIVIDASLKTIREAGFNCDFDAAGFADEEDDEISIANPGKPWTLGIQIGPGYVCVNRYTDEPFTMQQLSEHANLITAVDETIKRLTTGDDKP